MWGGVRGPGAQWVPGRRPAPCARTSARSRGGARGVSAAAACSREGACPLGGRLGLGGSASTRVGERAAVRKEGSLPVGRAPPACGQMEGHFVPRKPWQLKEDVKQNDPFLGRWLCLFSSSQAVSCP